MFAKFKVPNVNCLEFKFAQIFNGDFFTVHNKVYKNGLVFFFYFRQPGATVYLARLNLLTMLQIAVLCHETATVQYILNSTEYDTVVPLQV